MISEQSLSNVHDEELLDVVDEHDVVIGQQWRSIIDEQGRKKGPHDPWNIRAVNVFIENDQGELWIPRRTAHKKRYPLALDMSVSGCVSAGETYEQAFAREVQEEVNLDIKNVSWKFIAYLNPYEVDVRFFMKVYKIFSNESPAYNKDDYCNYVWMKPQQILDAINQGELHKPGLPKLVALLYKV